MRSFESGKRPRQSGHRPSSRGAQRGQMWRRQRAQMLEPSSTAHGSRHTGHSGSSSKSHAPAASPTLGSTGGRKAAPSSTVGSSRGGSDRVTLSSLSDDRVTLSSHSDAEVS